ncbi:CaiB/BaiF CoA-transferase family protein [Kerstersia gyiorum]|nr:CaiB/BaiF CoA-transferase family protein [Kerstersia gyiorum]MCP1678315.1 formyl-CoA transferase [Kerstersia gyiorum]MCP1711773.1 formyl-CoA transferase [Kerstersia gyiorum]MCP1825076.1 formyl-CoA transferase [Kerstersia gyiorum]MCP1828486.1 formyl-CoA transferase [Kerstersia gyiorum]MCW2450456.1 formyl-CoA transferase [Kerstersia gyiorum]
MSLAIKRSWPGFGRNSRENEMNATVRKGPLAGLKVIELAHVMSGPVGGLFLADMGADVIKVEKILGGDDTRRTVPPEIKGESASFMIINRNKRGIAIDAKRPEGREVLRRLIAGADVLLENFRPGTVEKMGLGYEVARALNPGLIYCSITGFGANGPYAQRAGYDLIAQGMSGLMGLTGEGAGRPPVKVGVPVGDVTAGILAATGILAAYIEKLRTGEGQYVDTSLLEASLVHTYWPAALAFATGKSAGPMGSAHPVAAPYQAFRTADGWINIGAIGQGNWLRIGDVLGLPGLASDPRFASNGDRMRHIDALVATMEAALALRGTDYWVAAFERAGVPAGPVKTMTQVLDDPQVKARDMVIQVEHPVAGNVQALGFPIKFSGGNGVTSRGAPLFGEHTAEVLREIGYSDLDIQSLAEQGVVHQHAHELRSPSGLPD